jgi:TatD DNase family protein
VPFRGKRNEPAFVARVVEALAVVRATTPARIADESTANFTRVFGTAPNV